MSKTCQKLAMTLVTVETYVRTGALTCCPREPTRRYVTKNVRVRARPLHSFSANSFRKSLLIAFATYYENTYCYWQQIYYSWPARRRRDARAALPPARCRAPRSSFLIFHFFSLDNTSFKPNLSTDVGYFLSVTLGSKFVIFISTYVLVIYYYIGTKIFLGR